MVQALRNRRLRRGAAAAALSLVAVLGGCAEDAGLAGPGGSSTVAQTFNKADVKFAQTMIPHHEQAIEMCDMILAKSGIAPEVTQLAQQIKDAQGPQLTTLTGFLTAWHQPLIPDHSAEADEHHWDAEGALIPEEMQELDAADGPTGQKLFLKGMLKHHKGAVAMVQDEIDNGQNPDAVELAQAIKDGQSREIKTMRSLVAGL